MAKRNRAAEAYAFLRRQRHWGVEFDDAWAAMRHRILERQLPHTTSTDHRAELAQWDAAIEWAKPAFRAAFHGHPCPMVSHYESLPAFVNSGVRSIGIVAVMPASEEEPARALELAGVDA